MSFYFSKVVDEVGRALSAGADVRLSGVQGSGRTAVLDHLENRLIPLGYTVHRGQGSLLGQRLQGQLISQLGVPWPPLGAPAAAGLESATDRLSALWSAEHHPILLLDDAHDIDGVSAAILRRAVTRTGLRVVRVVPHGVDDPVGIDAPVSGAAEAGVSMPPMTADDVVEMAAQLLGATPEPMLAARVLAKSGGNPSLSASIIATARLAGHIVLEFGQWRVVADSLWNRHLTPVIDARLRELDPEERSTLAAIALGGPESPSVLAKRFAAEPLLGLDRRGLLVEAEEHSSRRVHVWPPILADRFQRGMSSLAQLVIRPGAEPASAVPPGPDHEPPVDQLERRAVMLARRIQGSLRARAAQRYHRWSAHPSEAHALRYLDSAYGSAVESARFHEVLTWLEGQGPTFSAGYVDLLHRAMLLAGAGTEAAPDAPAPGAPAPGTPALGVQDAGLAAPENAPVALRTDARQLPGFPDATSLAEAMSVLSDEDRRAPLASMCDGSRMRAVVTGHIDGVLSEPAASGERNRLDEVLGHCVDALRGDFGEAIHELGRILDESSLDADRDSFLMASHALVLIQRYWGAPDIARSVLSTALSVGQPGVLTSAVFGAMLHWAAIDAHDHGRPALRDAFIRDGSFYAPDAGPFYGMGTDFVCAIVAEDVERFDEAVARAIRVRLERGYVVAGLHVGLNALQRHIGPALLDALAEAPEQPEESVLAFIGPLARAIREGDVVRAGALLAHLPRGAHLTSSRIVAAAMRWWRAQGDDARTEGFAALLGPSRDPAEEALKGLSKREQEIATMARILSNAEIAERLGLSVRTVENHVSRSLKKTGLSSRAELARRVFALRRHGG